MNTTNFKEIIDSYSDEAFHYCVDVIFDTLGYKVLQKEDVRRIDLLEKAISLDDAFFPKNFFGETNRTKYFTKILNTQISDSFLCLPESRAEKYKARALEIISDLNNGASETKLIGDLVRIYICLGREYIKNLSSSLPLSDIRLSLTKDDLPYLNKLRETKFIISTNPEFIKKIFKMNVLPEFINQSDSDKTYAYFICVLYFVCFLENADIFKETEKEVCKNG